LQLKYPGEFLVIISATLITLALIFYSIGVWSERLAKYLKLRHVVAFWTGFTFDISGTYAMHLLANEPFDITKPHTLTGQIALWLMLFHAIWATVVVVKKNESLRNKFHKFSIVVWLIWLIPYFEGLYLGMNK
jgi:uncharacterized repeat protein (TIGR03987 family)